MILPSHSLICRAVRQRGIDKEGCTQNGKRSSQRTFVVHGKRWRWDSDAIENKGCQVWWKWSRCSCWASYAHYKASSWEQICQAQVTLLMLVNVVSAEKKWRRYCINVIVKKSCRKTEFFYRAIYLNLWYINYCHRICQKPADNKVFFWSYHLLPRMAYSTSVLYQLK